MLPAKEGLHLGETIHTVNSDVCSLLDSQAVFFPPHSFRMDKEETWAVIQTSGTRLLAVN